MDGYGLTLMGIVANSYCRSAVDDQTDRYLIPLPISSNKSGNPCADVLFILWYLLQFLQKMYKWTGSDIFYVIYVRTSISYNM